jgi:hypothetical protein
MARKSRSIGTTPRTRAAKANSRKTIKDMLSALAQKLDASAHVRTGDIVLHLSGAGGGEFCLSSRSGRTVLSSTGRGPEDRKPLIEVWGDGDVISSILTGEKNALRQFMSGGIRIRGDLRYFSDLALEFGILEAPL